MNFIYAYDSSYKDKQIDPAHIDSYAFSHAGPYHVQMELYMDILQINHLDIDANDFIFTLIILPNYTFFQQPLKPQYPPKCTQITLIKCI